MTSTPSADTALLAIRDEHLPRPVAQDVGWTDLDVRAVDTARVLAADAVQKVGNGHPGTAMSLAPAAYLLYQNVMVHDPADPLWLGRDRFVLSCGHSSLTQYIELYLSGYGLAMDDLKSLRTWGSKTPGHPEVHHTAGVEITTGPLGSGLASAVGMAMAQRRQRGLFDPDAPAGESVFDHMVYVLCGDGDIQEGVSHEASALAGHQELGNLVVIYDQNHISIEDDTQIAFSEDVGARYRAYGWDVHTVDWRKDAADGKGGRTYVEDIDALYAAIQAGKAVTDKPTLVILRTIIAWPSPTKQDTGKAHGSALGAEEIASIKSLLGFDPASSFPEEPEVLSHARQVTRRGADARRAWDRRYAAWREAQPERARLLDRVAAGELPADLEAALPTWEADPKGIATRAASGKVLSAIAGVVPELWGGSADLAESNNTTMAGEPSFIPEGKQTREWQGNRYGRTLHFGIREFGMGAILNGIALEGLTRPYGGTFLVFSDYMRAAVRLACIQQVPVTFVWTHDSIGLGEDGPTHQPIEHLAALRAIPGLSVVRPADANETAYAWLETLRRGRPVGLALSRQALPVFDRSEAAPASNVAAGGYVLLEAPGIGALAPAKGSVSGKKARKAAKKARKASPDVILVATGSEVTLAVQARTALLDKGIRARVVSMPCREWFDEQSADYRESVLPAAVTARVSIEAGVSQGWREVVGDAGVCVSIDHFGASADGDRLMREFGFTVDHVVAAARAARKNARHLQEARS